LQTEWNPQASSRAAAAAPRIQAQDSSLTREQAAEIIDRTAFFSSPDTVFVKQGLRCDLPPGTPSYGVPGEAEYYRRMHAQLLNPSIPQNPATDGSALEALRSAGFLSIQQSTGCVERRPGALQGTVTLLTPEGVAAAKRWPKVGANIWGVPLARRIVIAVTTVKSDGRNATAEFSWRWASLHDAIDAGNEIVSAEATFVKKGEGWWLDMARLRDRFYDSSGRPTVVPVYRSRSAAPAVPAAPKVPERSSAPSVGLTLR
jgi:hypothetical protein